MKTVNIKAIGVGFFVDMLCSVGFSMLVSVALSAKASAMGMSDDQIQEFILGYYKTNQGIFIAGLFGFGFTALGGYIAARVAQAETLLNSAFVGSSGVLFGLLFFNSAPQVISVLTIVLSIPVAMLGGLIYTKRFKLF